MLAMCFNDDEIECDIGFKMIQLIQNHNSHLQHNIA